MHETDPKTGPRTLFVAHIDLEHARSAATSLRERIEAVTGRHVDKAKVAIDVILKNVAAIEREALAWHWASVRWLCRGVAPDLIATAENGKAQPLFELLGIPSSDLRPAGAVNHARFQTTRSIWDEAVTRAQTDRMGFLSAFQDGAWSWLDRGWEIEEHRDRVREEMKRRKEVEDIRGLRNALSEAKVASELERLRASWPVDPRQRSRSWKGWWE